MCVFLEDYFLGEGAQEKKKSTFDILVDFAQLVSGARAAPLKRSVKYLFSPEGNCPTLPPAAHTRKCSHERLGSRECYVFL